MVFTTEELGHVAEPAPDDMERILTEEAFGKFAVFSRSEDDFIQVGNNWSPSEGCAAFLKSHGSDPWVLECRDPEAGRLFRAGGDVTLEQVKQAFLSYSSGDPGWRQRYEWAELDV